MTCHGLPCIWLAPNTNIPAASYYRLLCAALAALNTHNPTLYENQAPGTLLVVEQRIAVFAFREMHGQLVVRLRPATEWGVHLVEARQELTEGENLIYTLQQLTMTTIGELPRWRLAWAPGGGANFQPLGDNAPLFIEYRVDAPWRVNDQDLLGPTRTNITLTFRAERTNQPLTGYIPYAALPPLRRRPVGDRPTNLLRFEPNPYLDFLAQIVADPTIGPPLGPIRHLPPDVLGYIAQFIPYVGLVTPLATNETTGRELLTIRYGGVPPFELRCAFWEGIMYHF